MHVLVLSYWYPPSSRAAATRMANLLRPLAGGDGPRITVLSGAAYGRSDDPRDPEMVLAAELQSSPLARLNGQPTPARLELQGDGVVDDAQSLAQRLLVPDPNIVNWLPFALPRALRAVRTLKVDAVVTTSPPDSTHLIGLALKRRFGLPWLADFQDGWRHERVMGEWGHAWQERLDDRLEAAVVARADRLTVANAKVTGYFEQRYGVTAHDLPIGVELANGPPPAPGPRFRFVFTGSITLNFVPDALADAIRRLLAEDPSLAERLEFAFAGVLTRAQAACLSAPDLAGVVRLLGRTDRPGALELQRGADALVLILPPGRSQPLSTKLFEYLGARRPVLAIAAGTAGGELVERVGAGVVAAQDSSEDIARAVRAIMGTPARYVPEPAALAPWSTGRVAADFHDHLRAIS